MPAKRLCNERWQLVQRLASVAAVRCDLLAKSVAPYFPAGDGGGAIVSYFIAHPRGGGFEDRDVIGGWQHKLGRWWEAFGFANAAIHWAPHAMGIPRVPLGE